MTTVQAWIDQTRDMLLSGYVEELDQLTGGMSDVVTTVPLQGLANGIAKGVVIEIDSEMMYIAIAGSSTPTVIRGYGGSSPVAHLSGAIVRVSPKFPTHRIIQAINDDLADLSAPNCGLFQMKTTSFTYNGGIEGYNLSGLTNEEVSSIYNVTFAGVGVVASEPEIVSWTLKRNRDTASFSSGMALVLYSDAIPGRKVTVMYKSPLTKVSATDTSVAKSTTGLLASAYDVIPLGVAVSLMATMPIRREFLDAQGTSRIAEQVPPGAIAASSRDLYARREDRIKSEAARLVAMYPQQWNRNPSANYGSGIGWGRGRI